MATSRDNTLGYRTYVVGTVKPVMESDKILLYNTYDFSRSPYGGTINLYNLNSVFNYIYITRRGDKCLPLDRVDTEDPYFQYRYTNGVIEGFNVIIYLSKFDRTPIGFTKFNRTQGKDRNISIKIRLETTVLGGINVELSNSLAPIRTSQSIEKEYIGPNLWNFTSSSEIIRNLDGITPISRYTNHLTAYNRDNSTKNIYQTNFLVRQKKGNIELNRLGITKDVEINPFDPLNPFENYQVSYYNGNLALYSWRKDIEEGTNYFTITSLTERNIFERQIYYTARANGNDAIVDLPGNYDIDYFAGRYIVCKDGTILDTINNNGKIPGTGPEYTCFVDPLDPESKIYSLPPLSLSNVYQYVPEIANTYLNVPEYIRNHGINIVRKIGSWFILKQGNRGSYFYILVNQDSLYYLTEEDLNRLFIVNDSVFMLKEDGYYLLYLLKNGEYKTERYRAFENDDVLSLDSNLEVLFANTQTQEDEVYRSYFIDNKIGRVFNTYPIYDSIFNLFRKNYYNVDDNTIPDIVSCCDGIFFYIQNNKLLYI